MPEPLLAMRLAASLGWYFALAERVSEGRRFLELAHDAAQDPPLELQLELLGNLCYLATEEGDLDAAIDAGERGLALAAVDSPPQLALVQLTLALALAHAGDEEKATKLVEAARNRFEDAGDDWGVAASSSCVRRVLRAPATSRPWGRWPQRSAGAPTRSTTTRFACRRHCSRRGPPSSDATARPPRLLIGETARDVSRLAA